MTNDIDPERAVPIIKRKIDDAKTLITEAALDVEALAGNPFAQEGEKQMVQNRLNARKYALKQWEEKLAAVEKALKGA